MTGDQWTSGPIGSAARSRVTTAGFRSVLVVVPDVVAGTELVDLLPLLEADHRVRVVFTAGGSAPGAAEFVRALGGPVVPWDQAIRRRFDLVLAAGFRGLDQVHGEVMVLARGLAREQLIRDGRVVAATIVLPHQDELDVLRESCPEAVSAAVVAGDICLDRMRASTPYREHYRRALDVMPDEQLVTVCSTWTPNSTPGVHIGLYQRLLDTGRPVAAVLHPDIWRTHGSAWLPDGLLVIPPEEDWRAAVIAADVVVGDHGSRTQYAAALGKRLLVVPTPDGLPHAGGLADLVYRWAPLIDPDRPVLDEAAVVPGMTAISSYPDRAGAILRHTMYRLMGLPEPARAVPVSPVALPRAVRRASPDREVRGPVQITKR